MPRSNTTGQFESDHGHTSSRTGKVVMSATYNTWNKMKDRCFNLNHVAYPHYGGRGITVCNKWMSFAGFLEDMGERPSGLCLERRDNNGNYNKENCYWATAKQQARNRRNNLLLTFHGLSLPATEWAERFHLSRFVVYERIRKGWSAERVLLTEVADCRFKPKGVKNAVCE